MSTKNLVAGEVYYASYRGQSFKAVVLERGGKLRVALDGVASYRATDGSEHALTLDFSGLSSAGEAITGYAVTSAEFWKTEPVAPKQARPVATPATAGTHKATARPTILSIKATRIQPPGLEDGWAMWFCSSCMDAFIAASKPYPEACPEGHPARTTDDLAPVGISASEED